MNPLTVILNPVAPFASGVRDLLFSLRSVGSRRRGCRILVPFKGAVFDFALSQTFHAQPLAAPLRTRRSPLQHLQLPPTLPRSASRARHRFVKILDQVRTRRFLLIGYAVMPEHVHLLLSEP